MEKLWKTNVNCQCGNHPCLEEDANCICKERGQSYPKIYCNGTSSNVPRKSKTVEGKTIGRPSQLDAMIKSVLDIRSKGVGIKRIAKELQIGVGTVYKIMDN